MDREVLWQKEQTADCHKLGVQIGLYHIISVYRILNESHSPWAWFFPYLFIMGLLVASAVPPDFHIA